MLFPGGVESTSNASLIFSVGAALLYAGTLSALPKLTISIVKTLAVGMLAVLAHAQGAPWPLTLALALSAAGDFFLSREGEPYFLAGLASFLAAHIVYVALFTMTGGGVDAILASFWRPSLAFALIVYGLAMLVVLFRRVGMSLRAPVGLYVIAIICMGVASLTLPLPLVIVGALLFITSDTLLAAEKFLLPQTSAHLQWTRYAVWALYYAGQLLIALGFILQGVSK